MTGLINRLWQSTTSPEGLEFISIILTIDGLVIEVIGVLILLSVDYNRIKSVLERVFDFYQVEKIHGIRDKVGDQKNRLRGDTFGEYEEEHREIEGFTSEETRLMRSILLPKAEADVTSICFVSSPKIEGTEIQIELASRETPINFSSSLFREKTSSAMDRAYYRQGGILIIIGFITMILSQFIKIWVFIMLLG